MCGTKQYPKQACIGNTTEWLRASGDVKVPWPCLETPLTPALLPVPCSLPISFPDPQAGVRRPALATPATTGFKTMATAAAHWRASTAVTVQGAHAEVPPPTLYPVPPENCWS